MIQPGVFFQVQSTCPFFQTYVMSQILRIYYKKRTLFLETTKKYREPLHLGEALTFGGASSLVSPKMWCEPQLVRETKNWGEPRLVCVPQNG